MTSGVRLSNGKGTACGEVVNLGVTVHYDNGPSVGDLAEVGGICHTRGGSSGGPYYKNHVGYGIHSGAAKVGCLTYYQGIREAQDRFNVRVRLAP
jgi:hypothetical protein